MAVLSILYVVLEFGTSDTEKSYLGRKEAALNFYLPYPSIQQA